jgi:hypothetical protein
MEDRWLSVDKIGAYLNVKGDMVYRWKLKTVQIDKWVCQGRTRDTRVAYDGDASQESDALRLSPATKQYPYFPHNDAGRTAEGIVLR